MIAKLLTEHHLEFRSFKGGCTGSSESTLVIMQHCWKSHALAHIIFTNFSKTVKESPTVIVKFKDFSMFVKRISYGFQVY